LFLSILREAKASAMRFQGFKLSKLRRADTQTLAPAGLDFATSKLATMDPGWWVLASLQALKA